MNRNALILAALAILQTAAFAQLPPNYQLDLGWLLDAMPFKAKIAVDREGEVIVLSNGLIERTIRTKPSGTKVRYENLMTGNAIIRTLNPEAEVTVDGKKHPVGGLIGQRDRAFLRDEWIGELAPPANALRLIGFEQSVPEERFA